MKYLGGKYFIGKDISDVMKKLVKKEDVNGYLEPFCGALSVLTHMNEEFDCIASDYHPDLIEMWKKVQKLFELFRYLQGSKQCALHEHGRHHECTRFPPTCNVSFVNRNSQFFVDLVTVETVAFAYATHALYNGQQK